MRLQAQCELDGWRWVQINSRPHKPVRQSRRQQLMRHGDMHYGHVGQYPLAVLPHKIESLRNYGHDDADVQARVLAIQKFSLQFLVVIADNPLGVEKLAEELDRPPDCAGNRLAQRVIDEDARWQRPLVAVDDQHALDGRLCSRVGHSNQDPASGHPSRNLNHRDQRGTCSCPGSHRSQSTLRSASPDALTSFSPALHLPPPRYRD